jgi:hypothetical protein
MLSFLLLVRIRKKNFIGIDTCHDEEMKKLQNWLLYGLSASDINGSPLSDVFSETFVVVSKDSF